MPTPPGDLGALKVMDRAEIVGRCKHTSAPQAVKLTCDEEVSFWWIVDKPRRKRDAIN